MWAAIQSRLRQSWAHRGWLSWALLPIAAVFATLAALRRQLYRFGVLASGRVGVPVVVVGNVIAGGAGKTPVTIALVQHLTEQGWAVGVVSRGYGRQSQACLPVARDSSPSEVGDEPLLIHTKTGVPVLVAANRLVAAQTLLQQYPATQILVCDDGLQHYGLQRDIEICVFDDRGCGNGRLLPAGPLREPWPRAVVNAAGQTATSSLVLHTGSAPAFAGHRAYRSLADFGIQSDGARIPLQALCAPHAPPVLAMAGISKPEEFFAMLQAQGFHLAETLALSDHYDFDSNTANKYPGLRPICTEKDAVKLWRVNSAAIAIPLVCHLDAEFWIALDALLKPPLPTKLSSPHGHSTT
jgi:tetraacyldisaccharide 4'-kinase